MQDTTWGNWKAGTHLRTWRSLSPCCCRQPNWALTDTTENTYNKIQTPRAYKKIQLVLFKVRMCSLWGSGKSCRGRTRSERDHQQYGVVNPSKAPSRCPSAVQRTKTSKPRTAAVSSQLQLQTMLLTAVDDAPHSCRRCSSQLQLQTMLLTAVDDALDSCSCRRCSSQLHLQTMLLKAADNAPDSFRRCF